MIRKRPKRKRISYLHNVTAILGLVVLTAHNLHLAKLSTSSLMPSSVTWGTDPLTSSLASFAAPAADPAPTPLEYSPALVEYYALYNSVSLGYNTTGNNTAATCTMIKDETLPIHDDLVQYFKDLEQYNELVKNFTQIPDLRLNMTFTGDNQRKVCEKVKLHPEGLEGIFQSRHLSKSSQGYIEPLLPTMRHHKICDDVSTNLFLMEYFVHDFYAMCLQLKKSSRTIFVDMGASLDFHKNDMSPALYINSIYRKFGFEFDHIYAYEIAQKDPSKVFELVPDELQSSWHWINIGVSSEPGDKRNPFTMLRNKYGPDDFIVVKLDIDSEEPIEVTLAEQVRDDPDIFNIVDQFYFEHHVHQKELEHWWWKSMKGSVRESLELMSDILKRGVAAHYWP